MKSINARVRNVSLLAVLSLMAVTAFATPEVGQPAPEFKMQDQNGDWRSLSDYRGKWVALYFYPKDDTPGCTTQACAFRDNIFAFRKIDAEIVGISLDDVETHQEFAEKYSLPFTLLSDPDIGEYVLNGLRGEMDHMNDKAKEALLAEVNAVIAAEEGVTMIVHHYGYAESALDRTVPDYPHDYDYYDENLDAVDGAEKLKGMKSVVEMGNDDD